ncbi:hypothetical protein HBI52_001540 [Parastagonospora nodorum]|nr:hypothetical protein HBI47_181920 [Parastagonospora nodorum]KAH5532617.1 hypothetical protein HBI52_001540 [Parastagonospora nodorum]KAH5697628.1 hypothetical protein HBI44_090340 [Parastagonospora nodorum]
MAVLSTLNGDVQSLMDAYLWEAINLDAPTWWLHPIFMTLWSDKGAFEQICEAAPQLTFAPGLAEVLDSPTPPTLEYFRSLPTVINSEWRKHWAIYVHIYELEGRKPRLYLGSATAQRGATPRLDTYEKATGPTLPRFVKKAIAQGFRKTRTALLAWSDIAPPGIFPKARQRYYGIEGIFQMLFFASIFNKYESEWIDLMPWCREDVEWEPLCSHISLNERGKGDFDLSSEVLESMEAARRKSKAIKNRESSQKHKVARAIREKTSLQRTKASGKHMCHICNKSFTKPYLLKRHNGCAAHKRNVLLVARGGVVKTSSQALHTRKYGANARATHRFYCDTCEKPFGRRIHLDRHFDTIKHHNAAERADADLLKHDPEDDNDVASDSDEDDEDLDTDLDDAHDPDADRDGFDAEALGTDLDGFQVSDGD